MTRKATHRRLLYWLHGRLTMRMFRRDPPRLNRIESVTMKLVRVALDFFEMRDFNRGRS